MPLQYLTVSYAPATVYFLACETNSIVKIWHSEKRDKIVSFLTIFSLFSKPQLTSLGVTWKVLMHISQGRYWKIILTHYTVRVLIKMGVVGAIALMF